MSRMTHLVEHLHTLYHTLDPGFESDQCFSTHVQVCGIKELSCYDGHQEVSRCHIGGEPEECIAYRGQSTQARYSTQTLKSRADDTRSPKGGYQRPTKKINLLSEPG